MGHNHRSNNDSSVSNLLGSVSRGFGLTMPKFNQLGEERRRRNLIKILLFQCHRSRSRQKHTAFLLLLLHESPEAAMRTSRAYFFSVANRQFPLLLKYYFTRQAVVLQQRAAAAADFNPCNNAAAGMSFFFCNNNQPRLHYSIVIISIVIVAFDAAAVCAPSSSSAIVIVAPAAAAANDQRQTAKQNCTNEWAFLHAQKDLSSRVVSY